MYRIINNTGEKVSNFKSEIFMDAFNHMNEKYPDSYIVFMTKKNIQIVWNPFWENINTLEM